MWTTSFLNTLGLYRDLVEGKQCLQIFSSNHFRFHYCRKCPRLRSSHQRVFAQNGRTADIIHLLWFRPACFSSHAELYCSFDVILDSSCEYDLVHYCDNNVNCLFLAYKFSQLVYFLLRIAYISCPHNLSIVLNVLRCFCPLLLASVAIMCLVRSRSGVSFIVDYQIII